MSIPIPNHVRYEFLRPAQIVSRRTACPVAYLPLGGLEWHGEHNPVGLDALKAHALCCVLADRLGGLAFPPPWWGDNRADICEVVFGPHHIPSLPEDHVPRIAAKMGLPAEAFLQGGVRHGVPDTWDFFSELVERSLYQLQTLGFEIAVLICGHYPTRGPANQALERFGQYGRLKAFALCEHDLITAQGYQGDHAARWETSLMLAFYPELVDLETLGDNLEEPPLGVLGVDPRGTASAEYGVEAVEAIVASVRGKLADFGFRVSGFGFQEKSARP